MADSAEDPRFALRGASYHDSVGAGVLEYVFRLLRGADIAVGDDREIDRRLDGGDGVVFGFASIGAGASAAVHGQRFNARLLSDPRYEDTVTMIFIPTGADLECDGYPHGCDHGVED